MTTFIHNNKNNKMTLGFAVNRTHTSAKKGLYQKKKSKQLARSRCGPGRVYREGSEFVNRNGTAVTRKPSCAKKPRRIKREGYETVAFLKKESSRIWCQGSLQNEKG